MANDDENFLLEEGFDAEEWNNTMSEIPHTPWFIRRRPTDDGQAVIENGTDAGHRIAVCEYHIAEFIVHTVNTAHQQPD